MCGNAWCLHDDIANARKIYPDAPVIAVNGASGEVKAMALYSKHPDRLVGKAFGWIERQRRFHSDFTVHGSRFKENMPWVQHWWPDARGGGGSAWGARKLGYLMGYNPVVLCGAPLECGNYANHSIGRVMGKQETHDAFRRQIMSEVDWHAGCYSMSGATREILGEPGG